MNAPAIQVPKVRNSWASQPAGDIFVEVNDRGFPELPVLSATQTSGMVPRQLLDYDLSYDRANEINYKRVCPGDFVVHLRSFQGGFAHSFYEGITSPAYRVFRLRNPGEHNELFWRFFFASSDFVRLLERVTYGIRDGKSISFNEFLELHLTYPSRIEQDALAAVLSAWEASIENRQARLAQLRRLKKTMLSKMFPRAGESVPEIRFDGFEGEWSNGAFGVLFSFLRNNSLPRAQLTNQSTEVRNVHYGDVLNKYGEVLDLRSVDVPYVIDPSQDSLGDPLMNGDIVFADAAEDMTVGKCTELRGCDTGCVVSGLHTIAARPVKSFAQGFLGYALNSPLFHDQLLPLIQGTKVSSISPRSLQGCRVFYPTLDEQRAIGSYFTKLDQLIELEQAKHTKFQQLKAAFLSKMFV